MMDNKGLIQADNLSPYIDLRMYHVEPLTINTLLSMTVDNAGGFDLSHKGGDYFPQS